MLLVKRLRIKINKQAKEYFEFASEKCRLVYNFALAERIALYEKEGKSISLYEQKRQLPILKQQYPEYAKVYNKCLSAMYFRLDKAYKNFFKRGNKGFPKFKRKGQFISQEYPGIYIKKLETYMFKIPSGKGFNTIIARTYEPVPDNYKTVTILKDKHDYYASFIIEKENKDYKDNNSYLALDLGVKTLATGFDSEGNFLEISKFKHYTKHLDRIKSKRDKCKKGSRRCKKWSKILHKHYKKYYNRVNDYLHKVSYYLTNKISANNIIIGKLNLNNMKTQQSWFNRIIFNEWKIGKLVELLRYKTTLYGKKLIEIDESYTTQRCSKCGKLNKMELKDRTYKCSCGFILDRDKNSAINIMKKYFKGVAHADNLNKIIELTSVSNLNSTNVYTFEYI